MPWVSMWGQGKERDGYFRNALSLYFKGILGSLCVTHRDEKLLISLAHHGNQPTFVLCFLADPVGKLVLCIKADRWVQLVKSICLLPL